MAEVILPSAHLLELSACFTGPADVDRFPLYMFELIMDDAWGIKDNNLPYGVFLTQFLIQQGVAIGDGETRKERHLLLSVGEVGHMGRLEKSFRSGPGPETIGAYPGGECGGVSSTAATLSTKIGMLVRGLIPISVNKWADVPAEVKEYIMDRVLDHFDLDYTRHEDVRTVVETMMTARRTHRNWMHAYFKKFPSKEAALLKPHPDTTEEQWKELCDLFTSEAFMERMDAFQRQCDLEGKSYTEIEVYSEILGKKSGYVRG
ncbi:hypothetical protein CJ030_MR1G023805 [Morella rubra]|uniref:Uncharacterized protein n=1 Tax=Morella rubra TaxID=262757 RepID=A0A6A1WQA5_9ROSI|nr:hypothetical protein CJ030_MR1G023805 [Morella rubra]